MKICLLGASFDTGNLGVSALAESSIKIIVNPVVGSDVTLLGIGVHAVTTIRKGQAESGFSSLSMSGT